ncbi:AzlC family ABC transporter permease [Pullulanibacillus pueri]|nr:AzlC family ABC transporter permease [Pullulanibacillus pueri]
MGLRTGSKAGIPIAIGYIPIALTFGLIAKTTGLTFSETIGMSLFVYAGASQFMALQMFAAGTSGLEIILATFIINIRHFLMTASLSEKIYERSLMKRALVAYGVTDETFSVASLQKEEVKPVFMAGLLLMAYGSWVIFSGVGYFIGAGLPGVLKASMSIALYAMFIGLIVPSLKRHRKVVALFSSAAILSSMLSLFLSSGWAIVLATLCSCFGVEAFYYKKKDPQEWEVGQHDK